MQKKVHNSGNVSKIILQPDPLSVIFISEYYFGLKHSSNSHIFDKMVTDRMTPLEDVEAVLSRWPPNHVTSSTE